MLDLFSSSIKFPSDLAFKGKSCDLDYIFYPFYSENLTLHYLKIEDWAN